MTPENMGVLQIHGKSDAEGSNYVFEQDYIMRQIHEMVKAVLKMLFNIDTESPAAEMIENQVLQKSTDITCVRAMYKRLPDNSIGNGYLLKIDGTPHCIAWWDMPN